MQKRFSDFKATIEPFDNGISAFAFAAAGLYAGFDEITTASQGVCRFLHTTTARNYTDADGAIISGVAFVKTRQGITIVENSAIDIPISAGHSQYKRIDAITLRHEYQAVVGGTAATYAVIQGVPSANPQKPINSDPLAVVLGFLYVAPNAVSSAGWTWERSEVTEFAFDEPKRKRTAQMGVGATLTSGLLSELKGGNFFEIATPQNYTVIHSIISSEKVGGVFYLFFNDAITIWDVENLNEQNIILPSGQKPISTMLGRLVSLGAGSLVTMIERANDFMVVSIIDTLRHPQRFFELTQTSAILSVLGQNQVPRSAAVGSVSGGIVTVNNNANRIIVNLQGGETLQGVTVASQNGTDLFFHFSMPSGAIATIAGQTANDPLKFRIVGGGSVVVQNDTILHCIQTQNGITLINAPQTEIWYDFPLVSHVGHGINTPQYCIKDSQLLLRGVLITSGIAAKVKILSLPNGAVTRSFNTITKRAEFFVPNFSNGNINRIFLEEDGLYTEYNADFNLEEIVMSIK